MKKLNSISLGLGVIILISLVAFNTPEQATVKYNYKQVTTLESVVGAGLGRSSVMATTDTGTVVLSQYELKNFFGAAGINMGNVQTNEQTIVKMISDMQTKGWELFSITSTALNTETKRQGIFITRYLFRRNSEQ
ncbi:hypothetical protein [Maribellus mangrovi]|uniref:hypothetical protein n=1 Tax=Maribellus mangrovi TaxID=3133146 RepID=UPI0030EC9BD3